MLTPRVLEAVPAPLHAAFLRQAVAGLTSLAGAGPPLRIACAALAHAMNAAGSRSFLGVPLRTDADLAVYVDLAAACLSFCLWAQETEARDPHGLEAVYFAFGAKDRVLDTRGAVEVARRRWKSCEVLVVDAGHSLLECRDAAEQDKIDDWALRALRFER